MTMAKESKSHIESDGEALTGCYPPAFPNSFGKYNL